ncbi:MAG: methionine synthase [Dehalococcoidia bacterium]|nr:methionine synthase [Dehalococcoidia bacterium]
MSRVNFLDSIKSGITLLGDGATGSYLQTKGLEPGGCPEYMCHTAPDVIKGMAKNYFENGSDFVLTNSFGGNSFMLEKYGHKDLIKTLNIKAAQLAKSEAKDNQFVIGSIGPTGEFLQPLGDISEEEMGEAFHQQISALLEGGVDGIIFETMTAIEEITLGIKTAKQITDKAVIGSMVFDKGPRGLFTMMGITPEKAVKDLINSGADVVASNCGNGSDIMLEVASELTKYSEKPVMIQSNAGIPEIIKGKIVYNEKPEFMVKNYNKMLDLGVSILGGCCGTNKLHIKEFRKMIDSNN